MPTVVQSDDVDERAEQFRRIFEACYPPLHAYVRRRITGADVDDVVAEVLTVAWRRLEDIPPGGELPWTYGVARRTLANHRRSSERRSRLLDRIAGERSGAAPDANDTVIAALSRLRSDDQEILRLAAWEGLSAAEIAVVLQCSPNAATLRLSRARRRLRDELTDSKVPRTQASRKVSDA